MEVKLAAVHEAGHSVMQWLVGWQSRGMRLTVNGTNATQPTSGCPCPSVETASDIRRRLLVLFAGTAATQREWPGSLNNEKDWHETLLALAVHFRTVGRINSSPLHGISLPPGAKELLDAAQMKTAEIVEHELVRRAIDMLGKQLANTSADADGTVRLSEAEVIAVCDREIGEDFRHQNPWSNWIKGG